jgi:hypothetical protein
MHCRPTPRPKTLSAGVSLMFARVVICLVQAAALHLTHMSHLVSAAACVVQLDVCLCCAMQTPAHPASKSSLHAAAPRVWDYFSVPCACDSQFVSLCVTCSCCDSTEPSWHGEQAAEQNKLLWEACGETNDHQLNRHGPIRIEVYVIVMKHVIFKVTIEMTNCSCPSVHALSMPALARCMPGRCCT